MTFKKTAATLLEIELQRIAATHGFAPRVLSQNNLEFEMDNIGAPCLADVYGENATDLPNWIWKSIINILRTLYDYEGIEYIDITPYNFIEKDGKVWIIDFGHAYYAHPRNWFLKDLLNGEEPSWNPDFR
jgi:RIO-like serine/threonine protein kinase